jgi:coenzyme F420-reducing hydrogenase alpha subunit
MKSQAAPTKRITVDHLARVEGEGGVEIKIKGGRVVDVKLRIFEPPRFFEAFLQGRHFSEAPDLTARICGICPVAYQTSAVTAMESALGIEVGAELRALRRLFYYGEWIESHSLHIYLLHAPDFLGYEDAIRMARDYPEEVRRGLRLKKAGNALMVLLGGREIHPINMRVGGFYRVPRKSDFAAVAEELKWARDAAYETVHLTAELPFPEFDRDYEFVSLRHPEEYPLTGGRLVSNKGLDIPLTDYDRRFAEEHISYSSALHSTLKGRGPYLVGPLARYSLNFDRLTPLAQEAARSAGLGPVCRNPFQSIIVRGVEILHACDEALRLIAQYEQPGQPYVAAEPRAGVGYGGSEAPRGLLVHRYAIDDSGIIRDAKIVPPTSQNQRMIEQDLRDFVAKNIELPTEKLVWRAEQAIRNYDPCISCATHCLRVKIDRDCA